MIIRKKMIKNIINIQSFYTKDPVIYVIVVSHWVT